MTQERPWTVDYEIEGQLGQFDQVVLLSGSPRRKDLLAFLKPAIQVPVIDERAIEARFSQAFAQDDFLSQSAKICCEITKAKLATDKQANTLYLAADTIVVANNRIHNKPKDRQEALDMLFSYLGQSHQVVTAVALATQTGHQVFYCISHIRFAADSPATRQLLVDYVDQKAPYDKAGAYGIQELDPRLIQSIEGDLYNIIGLPVSEIYQRLLLAQG